VSLAALTLALCAYGITARHRRNAERIRA